MSSGFFTAPIDELLASPAARITVLTGSGISAESGIPTFRGPEGYWTIGSSVYMPEEVATLAMFQQHPREVWEWYLYRLGVCLHAAPNTGHYALADMETLLGDRFCLITQNIDNLHIRAGNSLQRTYQIHGNINFTRCAAPCHTGLLALDDRLKARREDKALPDELLELLHCDACGAWLRPHVLWFDEYYDETWFRFESSMRVAEQTDLLVIVGTSGATTLPNHVAAMVYRNQGTIVDINLEKTPFSEIACTSPGGLFIQQSASKVLPALNAACRG